MVNSHAGAGWVLFSESLAERSADGLLAAAFWNGHGWGTLAEAVTFDACDALPEAIAKMELLAGHLALRWVPATTYDATRLWRVRVANEENGEQTTVLVWCQHASEAQRIARLQAPHTSPISTTMLA